MTPSIFWIKLCNMLWDYRLNIRTKGVFEVSVADAVHYSTISYKLLRVILRSLFLKPTDVFVDVGCGKGRVVCLAARLNIQKVIGIEVSEKLCKISKRNSSLLRRRLAPIMIINALAQETDYRQGTVFYLFNPFGASTLSAWLSKMEESLRLYPRTVKIVYVNPKHEPLLKNCKWLKRYDSWERTVGLEHSVSFWESIGHFEEMKY